ncbi:MAG: hypothetical protein QOG31_666 [Thermoplasmata archaeon]|nr:hypothetical protein [Thermoplasmata archaeon]
MGVRSGVAVALVATALLGFTVAVPQDTHLGVSGSPFRFTGKGANVADAHLVHGTDGDVGSLLDRIDGRSLDPNLLKNLDRAALADLLSQMSPEQLRTLGLDEAQAAQVAAALRDPALDPDRLASLVGDLADRGLSFLNANGDGRFTGGEAAFADLDGDGKVSPGDVRLGVLALLLSQDAGLDPGARSLLEAFQAAGGVGLANPFGAQARGNATAATAPMPAPLPYPTDRAGGPLQPVCVQVYSLSLTCHLRTFVQERVTVEGNHYLFQPDTAQQRTPIPVEPDAPGVRAKGTLHLFLDPVLWTPVPALTPGDHLVSVAGPSIALARDGNGMVWARGADGETVVTLAWAVDLAYYDLVVPPSVTAEDVPQAMRPTLESTAQAVGLRIAMLAGADGRGYGGGLRALAQHIGAFGMGALPDRDARPNDLLAVAESQVGCARQRAEAFVLAAQALGAPARLVVNEAHVFAEAYVPAAGWRMVSLGGCGRYEVAQMPGHEEILVRQSLPYASGQAPSSSAAGGQPVPTAIDITESPASLRKNRPFTIAGTVTSAAGPVPAGIPVTFTYNRTKSSPGTAFCATQTHVGGYRATCQLGPDAPGGSLQLVARLAPALLAGQPSEAAYSDPPFTLQKATRLAIEGPARTAADVRLAYVARLVDEDGLPVPYVPVTLRLDSGPLQSQGTDRDGRALFALTAGKGAHSLEARFAGTDGHDPSNTTLRLLATSARLTASVDGDSLARGVLSVSGTLDGAAAQPVQARWRSSPAAPEQARMASTDSGGAYRIEFADAPPAGLGLVTVQAADGTGVGAGFTRSVAATATLDAPLRWQVGRAVPLTIHLAGSPTALPLTILADREAVAHTVARPDEPTTVLVDLATGPHTLEVRPEPGIQLAAPKVEVRVGRLEAQLDPVPVLAPGGRLDLAGTLRFEGEPVAQDMALRLLDASAIGRSDGEGRFHLSLALPASVPPGRATAVLEAAGIGLQQEVGLRVQRAARLTIEAPSLSFNAFGATAVAVRGEGTLRVRVGSLPVNASLSEVATGTLLLRTVRIDAVAVPGDEGVAPTSASREILVINPLTLVGVPVAAVAGTTFAVRASRNARAAKAHRYRFLELPQRVAAKVLRPALPPAVPRVFDPAEDDVLELRTRRRGDWAVRDGRGFPVPATVDGRSISIPLAGLAPGLHQLRLERGKKAVVVPVAVQPLRSALDDATRHLLRRLEGSEGFVTMEGLESALAAKGANPELAQAVRREAEQGLYAGPRCDRAAFHAYFEALDRAQAAA